MTKPRVPLFLVLGVFTGLSAISCGGGDNPAAPAAKAPDAVATFGEGGADAAGVGDVDTSHTAIQSWTIQDACSDGKGIRARLWEANGLRLTGRATRIFATRSNTGTIRFRLLNCLKVTSGCVGATTNPASATLWGVGLNAERKPAKAFCKKCSSTAANVRLICQRRADGTIDTQLVEGDDASLGADASGSSLSEDVDEGLATFEVE